MTLFIENTKAEISGQQLTARRIAEGLWYSSQLLTVGDLMPRSFYVVRLKLWENVIKVNMIVLIRIIIKDI